jgi:predicted peptidase
MDQLVAEFPVDTCRQYVTGISMGGFATWDIAVRFPERFAAVVPSCVAEIQRGSEYWHARRCGASMESAMT